MASSGQISIASRIVGPQGKGQPSACLAMNRLQAKLKIPIHSPPRAPYDPLWLGVGVWLYLIPGFFG